MKKALLAILLALGVAYASTLGVKVITAQTLPYNLTVAWDASADATSYNCYLDGVLMVASSTLTCSFQVSSLGNHVAGVTAVNSTFVPSESTPATVAFKLQQPGKPSNIKVK